MKVRIRRYRWHWICNHWPFNKLSDWYDKHRVKVKYDPWDTWNLDYTLACIILPGLKQLKETNHGMPWVDDEDVPAELAWPGGRQGYLDNIGQQKTDEEHEAHDKLLLARWDYVQDEMIHAFECIVDDSWEDKYWAETDEPDPMFAGRNKLRGDFDGLKKEQDRIQNGTRLFGKYFQSLWD